MKSVLYQYDVYPKVLLGYQTKKITVQPLGGHAAFAPLDLFWSDPHSYKYA